jgi:hypothetical protein
MPNNMILIQSEKQHRGKALAYLKILSLHFPEGMRKTMKTS